MHTEGLPNFYWHVERTEKIIINFDEGRIILKEMWGGFK
jgi:hypothetical protein